MQCKCSVKEISDGPFRKLSGRWCFFQETSGDLSYLIVLRHLLPKGKYVSKTQISCNKKECRKYTEPISNELCILLQSASEIIEEDFP